MAGTYRQKQQFLRYLLIGSGCILLFQNCADSGFKSLPLNSVGGLSADSPLSVPTSIEFVTEIPDVVNTNTVTTSFKVTPQEQVKSVECQLDSQPATDCANLSVSYTGLNDGDHTLQVTVVTKNDARIQRRRIFRRDGTAPVISVSMSPATVTALQTANFIFSAVDSLSGIKSVECALDAAAYTACTSPVALAGLAAGNHTFKIRAFDNANNASAVYTYSWSIDLTVPSVSITAQPPAITNQTNASFQFSGARIVSYECSIDDGAFASCVSPRVYTLGAGVHKFQVRGTNAASVVSSVTTYSWIVDTVAPSTPVLTNSELAISKNKTASISFSSTDANGIAGYQCSLDNSAYAACVSPRALTGLADGMHTLKVRSLDNAGNQSAEASTAWTVDTTAPVLTFTSQPPGSSTSTSAAVVFMATDSGSGLNTVQCSLDNAAFANCTSPVNLSNLSVSAHMFRVQAQDKVGNTSIIMASFLVTSPTAPPNDPVSNWVIVASEEFQNFNYKGVVRYGHPAYPNNWVSKTFNGAGTCSGNGSFAGSGDPAPGLVKLCQIQVFASNVVQTGGKPVVNVPLIQPPLPAYSTERVANGGGYEKGPYEEGAFRVTCGISHFSFNDPIVYPGQPDKSHLHMFFGNQGVDAYSTATSIANSGNSTCSGGTVNRTGYWVPALINLKNGAPLMPESSIWYYKSGGVPAETIKPFPPGLRMIAGNGTATENQNNFRIYHAYCVNDKSTSGNGVGYIPNCPVGDSIEFTIAFPACWDGVNLDSPDHKSHMAYSIDSVRCPSTHPVPLPNITLNIIYKVTEPRPDLNWKLSSDNYSGGQNGYSMHADWFNGWKPEILKAWMDNCINKRASASNALCDGRYLQ